MVKSILINDSIHNKLIEEKRELYTAGIKIGLSDLAEQIIEEKGEEYVTEYINKFLLLNKKGV